MSESDHLPRQFIFHVFSFFTHFLTEIVANTILFTALFETYISLYLPKKLITDRETI